MWMSHDRKISKCNQFNYKVVDKDTTYFIVFKIPKDLTRRANGPIRIWKNRFLRKMRLPKTFNWPEV